MKLYCFKLDLFDWLEIPFYIFYLPIIAFRVQHSNIVTQHRWHWTHTSDAQILGYLCLSL